MGQLYKVWLSAKISIRENWSSLAEIAIHGLSIIHIVNFSWGGGMKGGGGSEGGTAIVECQA